MNIEYWTSFIIFVQSISNVKQIYEGIKWNEEEEEEDKKNYRRRSNQKTWNEN